MSLSAQHGVLDMLPKGYKPRAGHGYTTTARLKSNDLGAYYTAYFTGLVRETFYNDGEDDADESGEEILAAEERAVYLNRLYRDMTGDDSKPVVKGRRLELYPKGMRFYRTSRNITRPETAPELHKEFDPLKCQYEKGYEVRKTITEGDSVGEVESLNRIYHATYRTKWADRNIWPAPSEPSPEAAPNPPEEYRNISLSELPE
jgi:hypothetical protein